MRSTVVVLSAIGHATYCRADGIPSPASSGQSDWHRARSCFQTPQIFDGHAPSPVVVMVEWPPATRVPTSDEVRISESRWLGSR